MENLIPVNFNPSDEDGLETKHSIDIAKFDIIAKILDDMSTKNSNEMISIKDSSITQAVPGGIITADISSVVNNLNLDIINPGMIKIFKNFKGDKIYIRDDKEHQRIVITDGSTEIHFPKPAKEIEDVFYPNLDDANIICSVQIDKETQKAILIFLSKSNGGYLEYMIQDNLLKGINIPEIGIYRFMPYINDPKKLDETNADLMLRSILYFPVTAKEYKIQIGQLENKYFVLSECDIGFDVTINIYEELQINPGGNIFI